ncbi:hypothetical protein MNBD_PLANCTO02-2878 [hydrothermal vent metagenome]|uniref:GGDEF domain-containing protein n=1 Tax=hydrothermal vent metagenome TaxID=652676 RepID=A0A3B1DZ87_9ZZZZ
MTDRFLSLHSHWLFIPAILLLGPLAVCVGYLLESTPGAVTLILFLVPTVIVSVSQSRLLTLFVIFIGIFSCLAEYWFLRKVGIAEYRDVYITLLSMGVLFLTTSVITFFSGRLHESSRRLKRELHHQQLSFLELQQENQKALDLQKERETQRASINYPMLLLSLQDIGRRITTDLDLQTLIPTIISTSRSLLKCSECQVYFWSRQEERLINALPSRYRDRWLYAPRSEAGMAAYALESRKILTRTMLEEDDRYAPILKEDPDAPDAIAPLTVGGELLGLLIVDKVRETTPTFRRQLHVLADFSALGIKNAQLFRRIEEMARRDGLTGLLNHASFMEDLRDLEHDKNMLGEPLSIIMCDIDHFKSFNDQHGHQAGDTVLQETARILREAIPQDAIVARYGGEEFICALPHRNTEGASNIAELLRETIEMFPFSHEGNLLNVTASFGVAEYANLSQAGQEVIRLADKALYKAKHEGRNRVIDSPSFQQPHPKKIDPNSDEAE